MPLQAIVAYEKMCIRDREMALAAKDLALTRGQNSAARPTRGAALSLSLIHI